MGGGTIVSTLATSLYTQHFPSCLFQNRRRCGRAVKALVRDLSYTLEGLHESEYIALAIMHEMREAHLLVRKSMGFPYHELVIFGLINSHRRQNCQFFDFITFFCLFFTPLVPGDFLTWLQLLSFFFTN